MAQVKGSVKSEYLCTHCGKMIKRCQTTSGTYFCDFRCKAEWQKNARPVSVAWLRRRYIGMGMDCTQIAKIVDRDPKSVWNWLKGSGIETRQRGTNPRVHFKKGGVSLFRGRKHSNKTKRKLRDARLKDGRCPALINGVHWMRVYPDRQHPGWKGGITPERAAFYSSPEWKSVVPKVWKRDNATCQRCGVKKKDFGGDFDIHHIVSFEFRPLRATLSNLILLCEPCHYWVHGKKNKCGKFIKPTPKI